MLLAVIGFDSVRAVDSWTLVWWICGRCDCGSGGFVFVVVVVLRRGFTFVVVCSLAP